jgi:hypothetical protein
LNNRKTSLLFLVATGTSFGLIYGGHYLAYLYVRSKSYNTVGELMTVGLIEIFLILPTTSIAVGVFIGLLELKSRFWMAGVSLLPLLVFMLYGSLVGRQLFLACIYLFLSLITARLASWLAHRKKLI